MIRSKKDLEEYLRCDQIALGKEKYKKPRFLHDVIWSYEILLRKCEYFKNCRNDFFGVIVQKLLNLRFVYMSQRLGFSIPFNVCGKGLSIAHYGSLVISAEAHIGEFFRVHENVTIGVTGKAYNGDQQGEAAVIGNNVFIATGAKIIGKVRIADGVVIGANSVVIEDILEPNTTWGGVPARKISDNDSSAYIWKGSNNE